MSDQSASDADQCWNCDATAKWVWWNGKGGIGRYCDDHAREELPEDHKRPITRREDKSDGYVLSAGIKPLGSMFPVFRSQAAFDRYLDTDGEEPHQCDVSYCSNVRDECHHQDGESDIRADGGTVENVTEHVGDYAIVGDCAGCGGQMIETFSAEKDDERRVTLRCQDCNAEAELRHDFDDGLEGGSWSGVGDPEIKPVSWIDCPRCHGYGEVEDPICDLRRAMNGREHPCPNCDASGSVPRIVETDGGTVEDVRERSDCPNCDDGGSVRMTPEAGYATCVECGERGYWRDDGTEWWRNDPDSQWYVDTGGDQQ